MLDRTDRHFRYFLRLISRHAFLYSEMVTASALLHGERMRLLGFDPREKPLALQLGGSRPQQLARCSRIGCDFGYDEINLNVGCPSERVRDGRFGACLMAEPRLVADCVAAMRAAVPLPVSIKTRIGIDRRDSYEDLEDFVGTVAAAGCKTFIIHARKAWLDGLSPKQNREIPPLRYDFIHRLKRDFAALEIVLNGGITGLDQAECELARVDGVMIGREAYANPYMLAEVDRRFYGDLHEAPSREEVLEAFVPYARAQMQRGVPLQSLTRHLPGLFHAVPGARAWRRHLSVQASGPRGDPGTLLDAAPIAMENRIGR